MPALKRVGTVMHAAMHDVTERWHVLLPFASFSLWRVMLHAQIKTEGELC